MSVIVNRNTTQTPMTGQGNTGVQVVRFVPASRVYLKSPDSISAAPVQAYYTKSNGVTPTGWTDLGIMNGPGTITYTKNKKKIQTGLDKITRGMFIDQKTAMIEAELDQFDDTVLTQMTGLNPSIITAGSIINLQVGQEDVVQKAMLLIAQNKLDGKEIQWYHPQSQISFSIVYSDDSWRLKMEAELIAYQVQGASAGTPDSLVSCTVLA